jgi:hypothetical protein
MDDTADAVARAADIAAPDEGMIRAHVAFTLLRALTEACTAFPLDAEAVAQAAKAHNHHSYARQISQTMTSSQSVEGACAQAAAVVAGTIDRPNLSRHIRTGHAAAQYRPKWDPAAATVHLGPSSAPIRTRNGGLIIALWDLHHAAGHAAASVLAALPERASAEGAAAALSAAIAEHTPVAAARIAAAISHGSPAV